MALYLLIKEHKKTGLKYLCKHEASSFSDCQSYPGSGIYWRRHLRANGNDVKTTCLYVTENKEDFRKIALEYSLKFDVINSDQWANLCNEQGQGGDCISDKEKFGKLMSDILHRPEIREKHLKFLKENIKNIQPLAAKGAKEKLTGVPKTEEHRKNMRGERPHVNQSGSRNNNARKIETPYGVFGSVRDAENALESQGFSYMKIWREVQKGEKWRYCE